MAHRLPFVLVSLAILAATGCTGGNEEPPEDTSPNCGGDEIEVDVTVPAADFVAAMGDDGELSEGECLDLCESHVDRDDVGPASACVAPEGIPDTGDAEVVLECTFEPISECG